MADDADGLLMLALLLIVVSGSITFREVITWFAIRPAREGGRLPATPFLIELPMPMVDVVPYVEAMLTLFPDAAM